MAEAEHRPRRASRPDRRDRRGACRQQRRRACRPRGADPVGLRHAAAAGAGRAGGVGGADAGGADPALGDRRPHRLPRGRQEAEDAEAASDDRPRDDAGGSTARSGASSPTTRWWRRTTPRKRQALAKQIGLGRKPAPPPPRARDRNVSPSRPTRARLHQVHRPRLREPCSHPDHRAAREGWDAVQIVVVRAGARRDLHQYRRRS